MGIWFIRILGILIFLFCAWLVLKPKRTKEEKEARKLEKELRTARRKKFSLEVISELESKLESIKKTTIKR
jgi:predicted MFS family arabinose efflux permease